MFGALPVIVRELRMAPRHPFTYWPRVGVAAAVFLILLLFVMAGGFRIGNGWEIFVRLQQVILLLIWVFVPLTTADCLSRERREGTLHLLALTRLSPVDVLLAKACFRLVSALSWLLAAVPMLMIPVLLGGVGERDIRLAMVVDFGSLILAICCGLLASVYSFRWSHAVARTVLFSLVASSMLTYSVLVSVKSEMSIWQIPLMSVWTVVDLDRVWDHVLQASASDFDQGISLAVKGIAVLVALTLLLGAFGIRRSWQEAPDLALSGKLHSVFLLPRFFRDHFRAVRQAQLMRNPVTWSMEHTTSARVHKWIWILTVVITISTTTSLEAFDDPLPLWILAGAMTIALILGASSSFLVERQNGALELLLTTPLTPAQIIEGRVEQLKRDYTWPGVLLVGCFFLCFAASALVNPRELFDPRLWMKAAGVAFLLRVSWGYAVENGVSQALCRRTILGAIAITSLQTFGVISLILSPVLLVVAGGIALGSGNAGTVLLSAFIAALIIALGAGRGISGIRYLIDSPEEARRQAVEILEEREFSDLI